MGKLVKSIALLFSKYCRAIITPKFRSILLLYLLLTCPFHQLSRDRFSHLREFSLAVNHTAGHQVYWCWEADTTLNLFGTSDGQGNLLEQVACVLVTQRQITLLTINDYLLKHNGGTIIYSIYIWKFCHFLLDSRDRQMRYLAGVVFLCSSIFQRVRLLLERF